MALRFVEKPLKLRIISPCKPLALPMSIANIAVPQKMPNAVSNVRVLLRDSV
jgi:hypothetical protein